MKKQLFQVSILIITLLIILVANSYYNKRFEIKLDDNDTKVATSVQSNVKLNMTIMEFYGKLASSERKVFSQNKEDGVIEAIFKLLNIPNLKKYFVEIGTEKGVECNTRNLRENLKWTGIMFDGLYEDKSINLNKENIHFNSVLGLFEKYNVSNEIDLLSEDTDYADYWIVEKILTKYKPKVLVHEVNQQPPDKCVVVAKSDELIFWDWSNHHGGSVCAFYCLAKTFDYTMVYCESAGVNCFWIRNDLIEKYLGFNPKSAQTILNPQLLFKRPGFTYKDTDRKWMVVSC